MYDNISNVAVVKFPLSLDEILFVRHVVELFSVVYRPPLYIGNVIKSQIRYNRTLINCIEPNRAGILVFILYLLEIIGAMQSRDRKCFSVSRRLP